MYKKSKCVTLISDTIPFWGQCGGGDDFATLQISQIVAKSRRFGLVKHPKKGMALEIVVTHFDFFMLVNFSY